MPAFQTISFVLVTVLTYILSVQAQHSEPTECDRGVKRHHPSQANVYQVFTRKDYKKQWLDYNCPEYSIFDPRECKCVESKRQEPPRHRRPAAQKEKSTVYRPESSRHPQKPVYDERQESPSSDYQARPKSNWVEGPEKESDGYGDNGGFQKQTSLKHEKDNKMDWPEEGIDKETGNPDCHLHRPSHSPSQFERWSDGQWVQEDCNWPFYTGLIWSQKSCRCEWGPNRTVATPDVGDSIPASCLMMLKITFDQGSIKDEGRHIWLNIRNKEHARVQADSTAVGGYSGSFRGSSIIVPYFKSNVLGDTFHIGFMFKLCPGDPDTDIALLHNDCVESHEGPSIVVTYQAWKSQIVVAMRTVNSDSLVQEFCTVGNSQNQWVKLDIRYGEDFMEVQANDKTCVESNKFYGLVASNNCPLTLLGEAFCGSVDEVIVTRGCTDAHSVS